jgi:hypothetical protein
MAPPLFHQHKEHERNRNVDDVGRALSLRNFRLTACRRARCNLDATHEQDMHFAYPAFEATRHPNVIFNKSKIYSRWQGTEGVDECDTQTSKSDRDFHEKETLWRREFGENGKISFHKFPADMFQFCIHQLPHLEFQIPLSKLLFFTPSDW